MTAAAGTTAIVLAGGIGSRFGGTEPKQLMNLAGHPVLHHTLHRLERSADVDQIVIAANPEWASEIRAIAEFAIRRTPYLTVSGGAERTDSVRNAVAALESAASATKLLVHDGVRPLASLELIARVAAALEHFSCVIPVIPSADPLVRVSDGQVVGFESRAGVLRGQSPQGFRLGHLREAFGAVPTGAGFATIFELVLSALPGTRVGTVEGELNNLKITTPLDRIVAGRLILED